VRKFDAFMFVQYSAAGYMRVKSSVFNLHLNAGRDGNDETKGGKLFQTRAVATWEHMITNRRVLQLWNHKHCRLWHIRYILNIFS